MSTALTTCLRCKRTFGLYEGYGYLCGQPDCVPPPIQPFASASSETPQEFPVEPDDEHDVERGTQ